MYIKQLESFIIAARLLNFGEAARTLHYSQSTISEQIHSLEEYLGAQLFERIGRKVFLTEQGMILLPVAERMVRDAKELKSLFSNDGILSGSIMVGAAETLCAFWLPPLLKEYRILYPNVKINIKVGTEELKRGELVSLNWNGPDIPIHAQMIFHRDKWLSSPLVALEHLILARIEK